MPFRNFKNAFIKCKELSDAKSVVFLQSSDDLKKDTDVLPTLIRYNHHTKESSDDPDDTATMEQSSLILKLVKMAEGLRDEAKDQHNENSYIHEWRMVSNVLDRFFLIIFMLIAVTVGVTILTRPFFNPEHDYHERVV